MMNEDQARIVRVYQYLLSKDVFIKQQLLNKQRSVLKKNPAADDVMEFWLALVKLEYWQEFSGEIWKLLK